MKRRFLTWLLLLALVLSGCDLSTSNSATWASTAPSEALSASLTVHFIDVGQADSALVECGGEYMLIDGGNRDDSQLVVTYLEQQGVEELKAVVCTHAHEDHVGGLPAVLAVYPTQTVYAPTNTYSSKIFDKFLYYTDQQGLEITIPSPSDSWTIGEASVTVLGPVQSYADTNNTSLVLLVELGSTRFLFTGDMETDAENDMLEYWGDRIDWDVDVLKVGHHGSSTSSSYRLLYECQPDYGVISVGAGNSYGHPHQEVVKRYQDAGIVTFRTDLLGTVVARSDGTQVALTWDNQNSQPDNAEYSEDSTFIGNINSKKFHSSDCSSLPKEANRIYFDSYQAALDAGYDPCSSCLK